MKWRFERPQRKLDIFLLDVAKQIFSSVLIHFINLASAIYLDHSLYSNGCVWYFVLYLTDTICILPLCFVMLEAADYYFTKHGYKNLVSGEYYENNGDIDYETWGLQTVVWLVIVMLGKTIQLVIQVNTKKYMYQLGKECLHL